jgi:DNA polymerase-3 subunit delta
MKLDSRATAAFLADPSTARAVLLYGEDAGRIRERGNALVRAAAGALDDPFRVATLDRDTLALLPDEFRAVNMTGGRRVVHVRDVGDAALGLVQAALAADSDGLLVLEAGELTGRSKLRAFMEAARDAVAIPCYAEQGGELGQSIATIMRAHGLRLTDEAAAFLTESLGNDRGVTRQELEKLALYAHPATVVDLDAALCVVGDMAGLETEDAVFAATAGDEATADRALEMALTEGASPVSILRSLLGHLHRLQRARQEMAQGMTAAEAARRARPPVFFRRQPDFAKALTVWSAGALAQAARAAWDAEYACKQTGAADATLCRHLFGVLARRAGRGG